MKQSCRDDTSVFFISEMFKIICNLGYCYYLYGMIFDIYLYIKYIINMRKRFESSDAIEIGLFNKVSCYYHLKYRFLPKKVRIPILWFFITITVKDSWHVLKLYNSSGIAEEINPDNEELWRPVQFDITSAQSAQRYRSIKHKVKTYNDLDELFQLTRRDAEYQRDKLCYNFWHSK